MNAQLADELTQILQRGTITTVFQPIFAIDRQQILGYEALSRGPQDSALSSPSSLFSCAMAANKLSELELLCRETAIKTFALLNLSGKLFLNVSPNTLLDPDHPKGQTLSLLKKYGLGAHQVVIELTEQDKVDDTNLLLSAVEHYRELGFSIAIDDLGAGYSGLKQWSEIQPDIVKIDRYFIDACDCSVVKREFLKSISELAKATNTRVIAEGIERPEELLLLSQLGINNVQGFFLEKPSAQPSLQFNSHPFEDKIITRVLESEQDLSMSIGWLATSQLAVSHRITCKEAHKIFEKDKAQVSVVAVDDDNKPVGMLYKEQLTEVFASHYGHALFDKKAIGAVMDCQPFIVDENEKLDSVSQQISDSDVDIRRDIIVTRDNLYMGVVPLKHILKHMTEEKVRNAQHANPLTMLPGNIAINDAIEQRIYNQLPFTLAYFDLNHFKPFNDLYGYAKGDAIIKLVAELLREQCHASNCFIGHIGGDDFMVIFDDDNALPICQEVAKAFDLLVCDYFNAEHIKAKGYWSHDRQGRACFTPLLSIAIGLVSPDVAHCQNAHQIAALAADAKKEAKSRTGSYVFECQRTQPAAPLYRLDQYQA
ncbi:GGDEF domain-containing protein [Pseudoalteromonas sp. YIC-656]|uniref:GGDEF domain-containing protein n=1 Tax=Pseudoalteromonas pernae TaxID=3118054 RepID=UPI0032427E46